MININAIYHLIYITYTNIIFLNYAGIKKRFSYFLIVFYFTIFGKHTTSRDLKIVLIVPHPPYSPYWLASIYFQQTILIYILESVSCIFINQTFQTKNT